MAKENNNVKGTKKDSEATVKKGLFVIPEPTEKDLADENKKLREQNAEYQKLLNERVDNGFYPLISINDYLLESVQDIEKLINSPRKLCTGENISTGFEDLDKLTNGFQPGEYIVLASRPGVGKSCLAITILNDIVLRCHKRIGGKPRVAALFSLEMSGRMVANRIICAEGGVNRQRFYFGMGDKDWDALWGSCDSCSKAKVYISDKPDISFEELRNKALRLKAVEGLDFLVIDSVQLLHLVRWNGDYRDRTAELSEISYRLKLLARELNIPVLVLSQLSRNVEARNVKRPRLSDLRDSGSLEEDADLVLLLYREDYYDPDAENKHTELIVAKNRFGLTDVVNLFFHKQFGKFIGLTRRQS